MKLYYLASLFMGSLVAAQNDYGPINTDWVGATDDQALALPFGTPWGAKTANNTNMLVDPPTTGMIRRYDFTISRGTISPDGYQKDALLVNGIFPGPMIEANWGDTIQVTMHNRITGPEEGTGLHWHGILQKDSQWMDGVPGVSQCPIPPGGDFTYSFQADLYGSSWYHSHYSAQYAGGILGPMIIHGPKTLPYDIDIGPVLLTDHYHPDYFSLVEKVMGTDTTQVIVSSDNNLINGRNPFDCSTVTAGDTTTCVDTTDVSAFKFTPGAVHLLRLINAGAEGFQKFSLDGHNMTVIANDFVPILPYSTQVVTLGIGQRTDVLIYSSSAASGSYAMRSTMAFSATNQASALAVVYYSTIPAVPVVPDTEPWPAFTDAASQTSNDDLSLTEPWYPIPAVATPATVETIDITVGVNATGHTLWTMNGSSFRANYNQPILLLSNVGNNSYPDSPQWNVYNFGSNSSIRIILNNFIGAAHPIHLHGHNMQVLSEGVGTWDGTVVRSTNPQRRDVQILRGNGYMVLQIDADNPGAWPLHCHIAWHVSAGLYVTVLERPDDIEQLSIPSSMAQTCRDWGTYTGDNVVDQIDSGLRRRE
ncbi:Cupredoxin [Calycina marina]|uniref:Cupredoxin n=1 Tax=Calycina marina TaxID=1763456 RepID=A0A9P8CFM6_9HELO|nr:Cupredoxin [Calycina marina]